MLLCPFDPQFFNNDGTVASGAKLYTYATGTTSLLTSYQTQAGTAHTNPITLDTAGRVQPALWLTAGLEYRLRLETAAGALIDEWDDIYGVGDGSSSYTQSGTGAVSRTQAQKNAELLSLKDYGGVCDGVTDDSTAYDNLRAALEAAGQTTCWINGDSLVHGHRLAAGQHTVLIQEFATIGTDNKIGNPNFASSASGWTLGTAWAYAGTPDRIVHTTGTSSSATYPSVAIEKGEIYQLQVTITTTTSGVVNFKVDTQNLFGSETRFFNAAKSALLDGDWFSTTAVATLGTEVSAGVGLEQLKEISGTVWYYTFVPTASVTGTFSITTDDRWGGSISDIRLVKVASPLKAASTISTDADPNAQYQYGMKVSQANFGVIAIGDQQTAALINGFATEADTGALNVAIGERAMRSTFDGIENVAVGAFALQFGEGSGNTAVGYSALKFSVKGMENTSVGYKSLANSTIGYANTTLGFHSMFYNASGSQNVALGHRALKWNLEGSSNTSVGYSADANAGASNNTSLGRESGIYRDATSAVTYTYAGNTGIGYQANAFGNRSIAIGYLSKVGTYDSGSGTTHNYDGAIAIGDAAKTVGNGSIAIGDGATVGSTSGGSASAYTNSISLGTAAAVTNSSAVSVGHSSAVSGSGGVAVGVGASASGTESVAIGSASGAAGTNDVGVGKQAGFNLTGGSNTSVGNGAGTQGSSQSYSNSGSFGNGAVPTGSNQITLGNSSIATLRCQQTTITSLSDARFKTDIQPLDIPDEFLDAVQMVTYRWIAEGMPQGKQMGVIAQQLDEVQTAFGLEWLGLVDKTNPDRWEATPGKLLFPLIVRAQKQERRLRAIEESLGLV